MKKLHLPFVSMPTEYITLLKSHLTVSSSPDPVFEVLRPNKALLLILDQAFKEFDDGRGLEKLMLALGWSNFRERMASLYIYKSLHGTYPSHTYLDLIQDIKLFEDRFSGHSVQSHSRLFLLGFYIKLANLQIQTAEDNKFLEITIPNELGPILKLSQGRSERIDWLILIAFHLYNFIGEKMLLNGLVNGKKFEDFYNMLPVDEKENMHENLLAYAASIQEPEIFLYEKI